MNTFSFVPKSLRPWLQLLVTVLLSFSAAAASAQTLPSPLAFYKLDGNAIDASGNGLHGQLFGGSPATNRFGRPGGALSFNGVSDWIDCGNQPEFNFSGSFSLTAWIQPRGLQSAKYLVAKYRSEPQGLPHSYGLGTQYGDGTAYGFVSGNGPGYTDIYAGPSLHDGRWHALALVYNTASGLRLFADGQLVGSKAAMNFPPFTNSYPLSIGALSDGQHFAGLIDDVRVYSSPLSDSEVRSLFQVESVTDDGKPLLTVPVALQNATATFSQSDPLDFSVGTAIDGSTDNQLGWAINPNITNQTAVFETVANIGVAGATTFAFELDFEHYSAPPSTLHTLGRFRLSVTTDPRDTFADGLAIGGDVTANWIVLRPTSAVSRVGATLTVQPDGSILASGPGYYRDVYTVIAPCPLTEVTGIRLEALEDPSLPFDGPGREPLNGNFVVSEFKVSTITDPDRLLPQIITQPESKSVPFGESADFSVSATGPGLLVYQWYFNGTPISGATHATLTLTDIGFPQEGTYWATVANDNGSTTSAGAVLHLKTSLTGGELVFSNRVPGLLDAPITDAYGQPLAGPDYLVQLYAGGSISGSTPIGPAAPFGFGPDAGYFSDGLRLIPGLPAGTSTAVGLRVWAAAAGPTYEMAVANGGAYGLSEVFNVTLGGEGQPPATTVGLRRFALFGPPRILQQPAGINTIDQTNVTLTVTAAGTSPLSYQWFKDGVALENSHSDSLVLTNVTPADSGGYTVAVENSFGTVASAPAIVSVRIADRLAPEITLTSPTPGVTDIDRVQFEGNVRDDVAVTRAEWLFNGSLIGELSLTNGQFSVPVVLNRGTNTLQVRAFDADGNSAIESVQVTLVAARELFLSGIAPIQEGSRLKVPLLFRSKGEVSALTLRLTFNALYLGEPEFQWSLNGAGVLATVNTNVAGEIRASIALSGAPLPAGTNAVASVAFRVRSVPENLTVPLNLQLQGVYAADGSPLSTGTDVKGASVSILKRRYVGDNNANDLLDVGDASILMRLITGLDPVRSWDIAANDLNRNGELDAGDVVRILRAIVGLDPQPGPVQLLARQASMPELLSLSGPSEIEPGQPVKIRVRMNGKMEPISGASFTIAFPTNTLRLASASSILLGSAVPSGALSLWNLEPAQNDFSAQTGIIHFAITSGSAWTQVNGDVLELTFNPAEGVLLYSGVPIQLQDVVLTDGWSVNSSSPSQLVLETRAPLPASFSGGLFKSDGTFQLRASGDPALRFAVEASEDLEHWLEIGEAQNDAGQLAFDDRRDPQTPETRARFYRLRLIQ